MMKKIISLLLICLLSVSLFACKKDEKRDAVIRTKTEDYKNHKVEKAKVKESDTFSEGGVSVSVLGFGYKDYQTGIKLHVKNDTEDTVILTTANLSINGYMCTETCFTEVEAKTEKDTYIKISNSWLGKMQITHIKNLEFEVKVLDSLQNEILTSDVLTVTTDAPSSYSQEYDASGVPVYEKDGVRIIARTLAKSEHSNDYELEFYVENNRDTAISIAAKDVFVNKKPIDGVFVVLVAPGKKMVDTMVFYEDDLKEQGIDKITAVSAAFHAFDIQFAPVFETGKIDIAIGN